MVPNKEISVVIPTYNRSRLLDLCLEENVKFLKPHGVKIFIVDNCSTDNTYEVVARHKANYQLIEYFCNKENLGSDRNFEIGLQLPDTDYVWLLGDSYRIDRYSVDKLVETIKVSKNRYDLYLLNVDAALQDVEKTEFSDPNEVMREFGWLFYCLSVYVFSKSLLKRANFERYRNTLFIHAGLMFEYIAYNDFKIRWMSDCSVKTWVEELSLKTGMWQKELIDVWYVKRSNFIFSLPSVYSVQNKVDMARTIHIRKKVSLLTLLSMREQGHLRSEVLSKDFPILKFIFNKPTWLLYLVVIIPRPILTFAKGMIK